MFYKNYSVKSHLRKLFMHQYERYLPTAFDESMSLLEKMNKLIYSFNGLIDVVNSHMSYTDDQLQKAFGIIDDNLKNQLEAFAKELEEQTQKYEEIRDKLHSDLLPDSIKEELNRMLLSGELADIINTSVFEELNDRMTELENRVEDGERIQQVNIYDYIEYKTDDDNWQPAIMQALEENDSVFFPDGHYKTYPIQMNMSNKSIIGNGDHTVFEFVPDRRSGGRLLNGFSVSGSLYSGNIGCRIRIIEDVIPNSDVLKTENTQVLSVGDDVVVKSQKNALSGEDTGDYWLLGVPTASQKVPFGEFHEVKELTTDTITLRSNLLYPFYNATDENEVNPAQAYADVHRVDFVKNVTFKNFKIDGVYSGQAFSFNYVKNGVIDGVYFDDSNYNGNGYTGISVFRDCLECVIKNSTYYVDPEIIPQEYYMMNPIRITNSQRCGIVNNKVYNGSQGVDTSFITGGIPNTQCYIENNVMKDQTSTGITTHGGDYMTKITGNKISGSRQGMSIRGRGTLISDNSVIGKSKIRDTYYNNCGIYLYQGGSGQATISNNHIRNFSRGIGQYDAGGEFERIGYSGAMIIGNDIGQCHMSIDLFRMWTGPVREEHMGIVVANNKIALENSSTGKKTTAGIRIGIGLKGVLITNNVIKGLDVTDKTLRDVRYNNFFGVYCLQHATHLKIKDNTFIDLDYSVYHNSNDTDDTFNQNSKTRFEGKPMYMYLKENEYINVRIGNHLKTGVTDYPEDILF